MEKNFVKDFSATTWVRILKFGTKLDSDELYCVKKNSHILLISPLICSFFFLSNENFCHRFLYPRYEVYRGYIVFAFSVIMFVCLFVCL